MQEEIISKLFAPIEVNNIQLKNRIAMAPMTRSRAIGNVPNELIAEYYRQRAGAGLIITEGTAPSANGLGYARTPGIYNAAQIAAWKQVTDTVHAAGGKIFVQLMHVGRIAHPANVPDGGKTMGASGVAAKGDMWTDAEGLQPYCQPAEMSTEEVKATIAEFAQAAENAIAAGFDGIELHGANGYLIEQFLNPQINTRTDAYGGSVQNRVKFVTELVAAVSERIGKERTGIRLSPFNTFNDMPLYDEVTETYTLLAAELGKLNISYIHLVDYAARHHNPELIQVMRDKFTGTLMLNGGYTQERAHEVIESGLADMVSFGSSFISNPDLPHRMRNNIELAQADAALFYTPGAEGFTDYAFAANN